MISCLGIVVYRGLYFGLYDSAKAFLPTIMKDNFFANFAMGWVTTVVAGLASYPLDTIRRRMMTLDQTVKYNGFLHCAQVIFM